MDGSDLLNSIHIASPCEAPWEEMKGDERVRFCAQCKLNVYNISEMTTEEAEKLVREGEGGGLCLRLYRRADGMVLTRDCPVGLFAVRRRLAMVAAGLAGIAVLIPNALGIDTPAQLSKLKDVQPFKSILSVFLRPRDVFVQVNSGLSSTS